MPEGPPGGEQTRDRLGQVLLRSGLITAEQLRSALAAQAERGMRIGQILVARGDISTDDLAWALSRHLGYPYVFLHPDMLDQQAVRLLPEEFLRAHQVLPILRADGEMTLAMADPTDDRTADEIAVRTGLAIRRALALDSNIDDVLTRLSAQRTPVSAGAVRPAAQHLQFHLAQALQQDASEIYFDPGPDGHGRVRYRVQGVPLDRAEQPPELHRAVVGLLRELTAAGESAIATAIAEQTIGGVPLHLVVTFLPTILGPSASVAVFPQTADLPDLRSLGIPDGLLPAVVPLLQRDHGLVAVGCLDPRLRAALLHGLAARSGMGRVWSVEMTPVYRRPEVNQTAVSAPSEIPSLLRGALGAGADLVIVDEVSARPALIAAHETGRRCAVLAGLSPHHVIGLLGLMVDSAGPGRVASVLQGVIAARPVRLLCQVCRQPLPDGQQSGRWTARGCEACSFTGYRGQRLLLEHWVVTLEARALLRSGRMPEFFTHVVPQVESQMRQQGEALITEGLTSPDEVARVVGGLPWT